VDLDRRRSHRRRQLAVAPIHTALKRRPPRMPVRCSRAECGPAADLRARWAIAEFSQFSFRGKDFFQH
jgi:hypothetical protein